MKSAALIVAQLHRNPHLIDIAQDIATRPESRRPRRRDRRRRRAWPR
jgi:hypothetical protein